MGFDWWTIRNGTDLKNVGNSYSIMGRKRQRSGRRNKKRGSGSSNGGMDDGGDLDTDNPMKYLPLHCIQEDEVED